MKRQKKLFIESANRLPIEYLSKEDVARIWDIFENIHKENDIQYVPDNICYCFTDYALSILSGIFDNSIIKSLKLSAQELTLSEIIYSLCIIDVNKDIANKLANAWIKRQHKIFIKIEDEFKGIPQKLWNWIFDDRDYLYKKLLSMKICFIGKGEDLFSRVNIKNRSN